MQINPFESLSTIGTAATDSLNITDDFDTFLTLLTTQLQNQDPLEPLDTNQMTQQLVQFAGVEQSIQTNKNLETLSMLTAANAMTGAIDYIGNIATFSGHQSQLQNGEAIWTYVSPDNSSDAVFSIKDASGNEVYSETRNLIKGTGTFTWNGQTHQGGAAPDGNYTLSVVARNNNNVSFSLQTESSGIVEGIDMSGNELVLLVNGRQISLSDISSIRQAPANGSSGI